jgi:hypothetical protein
LEAFGCISHYRKRGGRRGGGDERREAEMKKKKKKKNSRERWRQQWRRLKDNSDTADPL